MIRSRSTISDSRNGRLGSLLGVSSLAVLLLSFAIAPSGVHASEAALKKAVLGKQFARAMEVVTELATKGDARSYRAIVKIAIGGHDYRLDRHAGATLVRVTDSSIRKIVYDEIKKGKSYRSKIILLAVLARWAGPQGKTDPDAMEAINFALKNPRKEVIFTALKWIRDLGSVDASTPALIDILARLERKPRGRLYSDVRKTLQSLNGYEFEVSIDWKNYWKGREKGFIPKKKTPKSSGKTYVATRPSFFSVTVDSDRILFVIDVSSSMNERDTIILEPVKPPKKKNGRKGKTVVVDPSEDPNGGKTGVSQVKSKQVTRLERVKKELIDTIEGLPQHTRFNIMSFSHEIGFFEPGAALQTATPSTKEKAITWVRKLQANGATRTDKALLQSFLAAEIDTIYLLTDGAPKNEHNQRIPSATVLGIAKGANRFRKTRIHTIGFSQAGKTMKVFCRDLAKQNDGKCVLLK